MSESTIKRTKYAQMTFVFPGSFPEGSQIDYHLSLPCDVRHSIGYVIRSSNSLPLSLACFTGPIQIMTDNKLSSSRVGY